MGSRPATSTAETPASVTNMMPPRINTAADIAKANARLKSAGVDVSPVRTGRRPGTEVFSVNSHTEGVPTIVIGGPKHW